jgi:hypothetical protein
MSISGISQQNDVAYFIATSVYFILYSITTQDTSLFEKYISTVLQCSTNNVTAPVILTSLLYISRYRQKQQFIPQESEYKLWIVALMLADVELNDAAYAVKSWSQVSLLPIQELIHLRRVFLETIQYDLHVTEIQYSNWIQSLQRISHHVSSCLYYKSPMMYPPHQQMVYQSLMRQNYIPPSHPVQPMVQPQVISNIPAHQVPVQPMMQVMPNNSFRQQMVPVAMPRSSRSVQPCHVLSPNLFPTRQEQPMIVSSTNHMMKQMSNYMPTTVLPRY